MWSALRRRGGEKTADSRPRPSERAVFGGAFGVAWNLLWPGSPSGAYAMVGAAAMLGAAMQAPLASLALVLEDRCRRRHRRPGHRVTGSAAVRHG